MYRIRRVEERLAEVQAAGDLPGPVHLYIGQEAIAVGVCAHLSDQDWIASTHRGHGHFLAKSDEIQKLVAEVYGRSTGVCGGKGGSMHVADVSKGILGANGIVGGGIALAAGAALSAQTRGTRNVAVVFFGDGAANQGVLLEALNVAALWKLPLILVCENNGFSEFSPTATVTAGEIWNRATPFGVPGRHVDGNDVREVWSAAGEAIDRARNGNGATLLEMRTYRLRGHVEAEKSFLSKSYRSDAEVEERREHEPLRLALEALRNAGVTEEAIAAAEEAEQTRVQAAFAYAAESPWPHPDAAFQHMFA
jgi:pyruvate dehydrogenase E1 component alpha subunit